MLPGIHFFVGSVLSLSLTRNIFVAFLIGFISHHLLDRLPHLDINIFREKYQQVKYWDFKIWFIIFIEFYFFLLLTFYFLGNFNYSLQKIAFIGGLGGIFPDVFTLIVKKIFPNIRIFDFYFNFHKNFHFQLKNKNYLLPILTEVLLVILGIILFLGI